MNAEQGAALATAEAERDEARAAFAAMSEQWRALCVTADERAARLDWWKEHTEILEVTWEALVTAACNRAEKAEAALADVLTQGVKVCCADGEDRWAINEATELRARAALRPTREPISATPSPEPSPAAPSSSSLPESDR